MAYGATGQSRVEEGGGGGQRREFSESAAEWGFGVDIAGEHVSGRRNKKLVLLMGGLLMAAFVTLVTLASFGVRGERGVTDLVQLSMTDVSAIRRQNKGVHDSVSFVDVSNGAGGGRAVADKAAAAPSGPVPEGHIIHVDLPASEMKKLAVGSIVKGQVRRPMLSETGREDFNTIDFTGKVRSLQMITLQGKVGGNDLGGPDEGIVTVKMLSDQFIAPGTAVTGMVAGKIFKGTVTKAPSFDERIDEAEKRARELLPPVCDEICKLNKEIAATQQRIRDFTTSRKLRREAARLEKRTYALEHPPPPPETIKYVGNWAGFKFEFPQGPNQYGKRIKGMKKRLGEVDYQYAKTFSPLYEKTRKLEHKLDEIEGKKTIQERIDALETELGRMELCMEKFTREQCVQNVMKEYGYAGFKGREADEEEDKPQFVEPADKLEKFEAKGDLTPKYEAAPEDEDQKEEEKGSTQKLSVVASHAASGEHRYRAVKGSKQAWAPGQAAVWDRYMSQAVKMDGIHKADNIMANW